MNRVHNLGKKQRLALILMLLAAVLAFILMCLPAYQFRSVVFTKKSGNTFVGDERYQEALAEVNEVVDSFKAKGIPAEVEEEVTERVNSKGKKTSLVEFNVLQTFSKSAFDFFGSGLRSSNVIQAIILCLILALGFAIIGTIQSLGDQVRDLDKRTKFFRNGAIIFALLGCLLVPLFFMLNTYQISREVGLYEASQLSEGKEALYAKLDAFLLSGAGGEKAGKLLTNLDFRSGVAFWLTLPCFFVMVLAALQLRYGRIKEALLKGLLYLFVIVLCIFILYPYYVMVVSAFRTSTETNDMYFLHLLPTDWKFSNLLDILSRGVPRYLLNSFLIAGGATLIALFCGIPAAYALARMKFRGRSAFLGFVIMSQMFSPVVLLIGIAQLISSLGLNDSIVGLMLINAAFNQAFAIWLLRGTFVAISPEMEEAARIDGCSTIGSLIRVLLPMAAPGIVTTLIFVFINAWNEYTISTVLISSNSNRPITVGITQFSSFNMIEWQYLFASSLIATIPVVILFMFIEKHLAAGLSAGGVKG